MSKRWTCALALMSVGLTPAAGAAEHGSASAEALTAEAIAAVDAQDAHELLAILQEMQRRQMYFFEADHRALCRRDAPRVGHLAANILDWGKARQAYFTSNRMQRLDEQSCACPQKARSFATFSQEMLGVAPEEIGEDEIDVLEAFLEEHERDTYAAYSVFHNTNCQAQP